MKMALRVPFGRCRVQESESVVLERASVAQPGRASDL